MDHKKRRSYTLIELIIVIVLLGIISTAGAIFLSPFINLFFFAPTQTNVQMVGNFILDNIIEGNQEGYGLRNIKNIISASETEISYTDSLDRKITIIWDDSSKKFIREVYPKKSLLPFENQKTNVLIEGQKEGLIFIYFDSNQNELIPPISNPLAISRIEFRWVAYTGSGSTTINEGKYLINSGVFIKQF